MPCLRVTGNGTVSSALTATATTLENAQSVATGEGRFPWAENFWRNRLELVCHPVQALGMAQEQVPLGSQKAPETVDDLKLCLPFKIDDHIAAENQVKGTANRIRLLIEIHPLKSDDSPKLIDGLDLSFLRAEAL